MNFSASFQAMQASNCSSPVYLFPIIVILHVLTALQSRYFVRIVTENRRCSISSIKNIPELLPAHENTPVQVHP